MEESIPSKKKYSYLPQFRSHNTTSTEINNPPITNSNNSSNNFNRNDDSSQSEPIDNSITSANGGRRSSYLGSLLSYGFKSKTQTSVTGETTDAQSVKSTSNGYGFSLRMRFRKNKSNSSEEEVPDSSMWPVKAPIGSGVSTTYGTGTLISVREADGFHLVQLSYRAVGYFNPEAVYGEIKAIVGERVKTQWGMGTVEGYNPSTDLYEIALDWRWDDDHVWRMRATTEKFEKVEPNESFLRKTKYYLGEIQASTTIGYNNMTNMISKFPTRSMKKPVEICSAFTPFGEATLLEIREEDKVHVCRLPTGGILFLQQEHVVFHKKASTVSVGDQLNTGYGRGIVVRHRPQDGIFEIHLQWKLDNDTPVKLFMSIEKAEQCKGQSGGRFSSILGMTKRLQSTGSSMKATASGGLSSVRAKFASMTYGSRASQYSKGERVVTQFGSGYVQQIRPDGVYVIKLRRLRVQCYMHENRIAPFPYDKVSHIIVGGQRRPIPKNHFNQKRKKSK